jgi:phosphohistidine swiveling domain-containing protein
LCERERARLVANARAVLQGYPAPVRAEFEFLLGAAQEAVILSEDHNFWIDACCMHQVRRVFGALGRRLAATGDLARAQDVFYLRLDELKAAAYGSSPTDPRGLVAWRRAETERFRAMTPSDLLGARPTRPARWEMVRKDGPGRSQPTFLRGEACSAGIARGTARVMSSISEAGRVQPGDVLVADALSPSWTPLFKTAAAIVSNTGGILSHAAVVAREYGVPAVLGAPAATTSIRDGQMVEVDGAAGLVRVVSRPPQTS